MKTQCAPVQVAVCTRPCRFCTNPGNFVCLHVFLCRVCSCVRLLFVVVRFLRFGILIKTPLWLRLLELRTVFSFVQLARNIEQVAGIEAAGGFRSLGSCHESRNHLCLCVCVIIREVCFHKRHPQHKSTKRTCKSTRTVQGAPSLKTPCKDLLKLCRVARVATQNTGLSANQ